MQQVLILQGLPASGKSTYRKALIEKEPERWHYVSWDELRASSFFPKLNHGFNRKDEESMKTLSYALAKRSLLDGKDVIIDNTNLSEKALGKWKAVATEAGAVWAVQSFLHVPVAECVARDAKREGKARVGRAVIERMALFAGLIDFPADKRLVLVDMDGTLADCEHRRHYVQQRPKDWLGFYRECFLDPPVPWIRDWVRAYCADPEYIVCIVSGRPLDLCGEKTTWWLEEYGIEYDHLFMRNGSDGRKDFIVKQEILDKLPKDRIAMVIDDRQQVVDMWRSNGLRVVQVAEGNF